MKQLYSLPILASIFALVPLSAYSNTSGTMDIQLSSMYEQKEPDVTAQRTALYLRFDHQTKWRRIWNFNFSPLVISDPVNKSTEERLLFEAKELSFAYKKSSTHLKIGISTVNWEGTDFINPMDIVSPKIYFDPLNSEKRGSAGLFYSDKIGGLGFDAVYIPSQSYAKLPGRNSPWWPRQFSIPTQRADTLLLLPEQAQYEISDGETLDKANENNVALRLQYQGDSFDFSVAGFEGMAQSPILQPFVTGTVISAPPNTVIQIDSAIRIQPIYYKVRTGAFAFTKTLGSYIVRLSGQNVQPLGRDSRLPSWSQLGVLSLEKNIEFKKSTLTLVAQVIQSQEAESASLSLLSNLTKRSVGLGFRWPFAEKWTWVAAVFQEQIRHSSYVHNDLTWNFAENFSQALSFDVFTGEKGSAFGTYDKNDRVMLKTSYLF